MGQSSHVTQTHFDIPRVSGTGGAAANNYSTEDGLRCDTTNIPKHTLLMAMGTCTNSVPSRRDDEGEVSKRVRAVPPCYDFVSSAPNNYGDSRLVLFHIQESRGVKRPFAVPGSLAM